MGLLLPITACIHFQVYNLQRKWRQTRCQTKHEVWGLKSQITFIYWPISWCTGQWQLPILSTIWDSKCTSRNWLPKWWKCHWHYLRLARGQYTFRMSGKASNLITYKIYHNKKSISKSYQNFKNCPLKPSFFRNLIMSLSKDFVPQMRNKVSCSGVVFSSSASMSWLMRP